MSEAHDASKIMHPQYFELSFYLQTLTQIKTNLSSTISEHRFAKTYALPETRMKDALEKLERLFSFHLFLLISVAPNPAPILGWLKMKSKSSRYGGK